ncbi:hypothetical protein BH23PLA1_BH23PLA1_05730 [soil metagenome]
MHTLIRLSLSLSLGLGVALTGSAGAIGAVEPRPVGFVLTVESGAHDRNNTLVQVELPTEQIPTLILDATKGLTKPASITIVEEGDDPTPREAIPAQMDRVGSADGPARITFILPGETKAKTTRRFRWEGEIDSRPKASSWHFQDSAEGHIELLHGEAPVIRYNTSPIDDPDGKVQGQARDAYIHPAYTPSGTIITGDYSRDSHPHHRGFFLAHTSTQIGALRPDFWNLHRDNSRIRFDRIGEVVAGPVTARFTAFHRWIVKQEGQDREVLQERWDVEAYDLPGSPYWLFDLTSTQQATGEPLTLTPSRYGGMAYRGPDSFAPPAVLDVLTSEGLDRAQGDQKPTRWVDLTGPIAEGSNDYAGAAMLDHPANVNHPTAARIHPTRLPFFCYTPNHDDPVVIDSETPTVFRYRILVHDGRPEADRNEAAWRDFAEPPQVTVESIGR